MSYDLSILGDDSFSRAAPKAAIATFIASLPDIKPNGDFGFALDRLPNQWMEIDLEVVNSDGDNIQESWRQYDEINCIRLHIPYPFLGDAFERDYLPTALAIAERLGWRLVDDQSGKVLLRGPMVAKPWWRFW